MRSGMFSADNRIPLHRIMLRLYLLNLSNVTEILKPIDISTGY